MNKVDIVILILAAFGAWVASARILDGSDFPPGYGDWNFLGFKLMGEVMILLDDRFDIDRSTLPYISFIVIFIVVVLLVRLLGSLVKNSIDKSFLGSVDQALGGGLGHFAHYSH